MRYIITTLLCLFVICESQTQDCSVCKNEDVQLTSNLTGTTPIIYSWVCTNGFTSNVASPLVPNVSEGTTCTLNAIDALNCTLVEDLIIEVYENPTIVIAVEDCNILFFENDAMGQNCNSFDVEFLDGGVWTIVSTSLPYTATEDGDYRVVYACECGDVISNILTVENCTDCTAFAIADFGDCDIIVNGFSPCTTYEVWANIDAVQTCDPDTPPCDESAMTMIGTNNGVFFPLTSDGCYQFRCNTGGVDYCSNIVCFDDDCETGCNDVISFTTSPGNPPCMPFNSINWPCGGVGDWSISESGTVLSSGTNSPPGNYTFTYDATYIFTFTCNDGCVYSSSYTVTGCGTPPCDPESTLTIIDNDCVLTALVSNCDGTASFLWSTGQTTPSIVVTADATYSVTVTGCCTDPLIDNISVVCDDPCDGFAVSISGAAILCDGDTETYSANISGGTPPFAYLWELNSVPITTAATYTHTYLGGTDNITLTVTDSENCMAVASIFIIEDTDCCEPALSLVVGGSGLVNTKFCDRIEVSSVFLSNTNIDCDCEDDPITINYDYAVYEFVSGGADIQVSSGNTSANVSTSGINVLDFPFDLCDIPVGENASVDFNVTSDNTDCELASTTLSGTFVSGVITQADHDACGCCDPVTDIFWVSGQTNETVTCSTADIQLLSSSSDNVILEADEDVDSWSINVLQGSASIVSSGSSQIEIFLGANSGFYTCSGTSFSYRIEVTANSCGSSYTEELVVRLQF